MSARDSRRRFSGIAETYARYRPSYPPELLDWILARARLGERGLVIDLGCGTGITTRLFSARGLNVVGVDPNEDMLAAARGESGARYQKGESSATGLPDASASLVVSGQAFHWFDLTKTMPELKRVLRPDGACAAFWNQRGLSPVHEDYEALLHRHCAEYENFTKGTDTLAQVATFPGLKDFERVELANRQLLTREEFFGRINSSSYVAAGISDRASFEREAGLLFDKHQKNGRLDFTYRTLAGFWRFAR